MQDSTGKLWVSWTRSETSDLNIKFVDTNGNGVWDPGESIVYDSNGNGVYNTGEPVIAGTTPANLTPLKLDPRIGFIDTNGNRLWDRGEFVVYDPNVDAIYNPKLRFVDSNHNNVWDVGEAIIYDANSDGVYTSHVGTAACTGTRPPSSDCVIIGTQPLNQTLLTSDPHLKFVDLNSDNVWEPGETLVYDTNNNGIYDVGERAIPALAGDPKLKYIGPGTVWMTGNTVVYDTNGNGIYDGKIKYVDSAFVGHWVPGDTVVYDSNLNNQYDLFDTPIYETIPQGDLGKPLKNDPGLRFVDTDGNSVWEPGEPVVYDSNLNSVYDGRLMYVKTGTNTTWVPGETVVYDSNGDGLYTRGRYYNDTIIAGLTPLNGTALSLDPKLKFYDTNGNTVWDVGEPVVYDTNNNNLYDAEITIGPPVPTPAALLRNDPKIMYVGLGTTWAPGNPVVYDSDGNGLYEPGEPVISGATPANQTALKFDQKIRYVNATTNPLETWSIGKSVVYDANGDSKYTSEPLIAGSSPLPAAGVTTGLGEPVIAPGSPNVGSALIADPKLKYVQTGTNTTWVPGETVVYDTNGNGLYDAGEPVIVGSAPVLGTTLTVDPLLKFSDVDGNGVWDSSEAVVYDNNNSGIFNLGKYIVRGTIPQASTILASNLGEPWIAGPPPVPGTSLQSDSKVRFVDTNGNLVWDPGEPVAYDTNNNGIFDVGIDIIIAGNPVPVLGTILKGDEMTIAGTFAAPRTNPIVTDPKIKFVQTGTNATWVPGETVVYDTAGTGNYAAGRLFNDTIILGAAPANNTALRSDPKLKYFEQIGGTDNHWDLGEPVFYDANNDGIFQANETIINAFTTPSTSAKLISDPKIKYFDSSSLGHWIAGDSVVYDTNNNNRYDAGDITIAGTVPATNTTLTTDAHIKFVNTVTGNSTWSPGQSVVFDSNNNNIYDPGEPIIVSSQPTGGAPLRTATHVFYETNLGGTWSTEQRLSTQPKMDFAPSMMQALDGRIWVVWEADRGGGLSHQIVGKTTTDGVSWTLEVSLTNIAGTYGDSTPTVTQDRDGTIWLVWSRNVICTGCPAKFQADLFYTSSTNNGLSWAPATALTSTTNLNEIQPSIIQLSDKTLYIFYTQLNCPLDCTVNLFYFSTLVQIHDARMNTLSTNATITITYGPTFRSGQALRISANVSNTGDFSDTFKLTVKANSTLVPTNSTVVAPGQWKIIFIDWRTAGMTSGNYILTANVTVTTGTEGLANLIDNTATYTVLIRPAGDVNGDCKVNIIDLVLVASNFGRRIGDPGWNPIADLNGDGVINIIDLSIVGGTFGQKCPGTL